MILRKVINSLLFILISVQALSQKELVRYQYKISHPLKDSIVSLIEIDYYNNKVKILRSIVFGPDKDDTCETIYSYDNYGNLMKEVTKCSSDTTVSFIAHQYNYNKKGKIIKVRTRQASEEILTIEYLNDTTITTSYSNERNEERQLFEYRFLEIYNNATRGKISFKISSKGDTFLIKKSLYFPLRDTALVRAQINNYCGVDEVNYLNSFNEAEITDYYDENKYTGYSLRKYNDKKKLEMEMEYSIPKNAALSKTKYFYNNNGKLFEMREYYHESISKIYKYDTRGRITREDYFLSNILDHSIVYKYQ